MAQKKTSKKTAKKKPDAAELSRDSDIEKVRVEKEVPVSMNREESERQAHALASTTIKIKAIQDKIAEFAAKHRKELRDLRKDEQRLATAIDTGKVMRAIKCTEVRDYKLNQLRYVDDNGVEVAPAEPMPPEMRQKTIFDAPPAGDRVDVDDDEDAEE